jgi:hypothetical protein
VLSVCVWLFVAVCMYDGCTYTSQHRCFAHTHTHTQMQTAKQGSLGFLQSLKHILDTEVCMCMHIHAYVCVGVIYVYLRIHVCACVCVCAQGIAGVYKGASQYLILCWQPALVSAIYETIRYSRIYIYVCV